MDLISFYLIFISCPLTDGVPFALLVFEINISTGSNDNIKPEFALYHFFKSFGIETQERASFFIHRVDMLTRDADGNLISLDDVGYEL